MDDRRQNNQRTDRAEQHGPHHQDAHGDDRNEVGEDQYHKPERDRERIDENGAATGLDRIEICLLE